MFDYIAVCSFGLMEFGLFPFGAGTNLVYVLHIFFFGVPVIFLDVYFGMELLGHMQMLSSDWHCQIVFQSVFTNLHLHCDI